MFHIHHVNFSDVQSKAENHNPVTSSAFNVLSVRKTFCTSEDLLFKDLRNGLQSILYFGTETA